MTRSLLGLAALVALPAWAQEPVEEVQTPYETVVERPLDATGSVSSSSLGAPEASGQSAVAPASGAPEVTAYDAAMSNAQRTASEAPASSTKIPLEMASPTADGESVDDTTASDSPWAQAMAAQQAKAAPVVLNPQDSAALAAPISEVAPAMPEVTDPLPPPVPVAPPAPVVAPAVVVPPAPVPLAVPASTPSPQSRPFIAPGAALDADQRERSARENAAFHPAPAAPVAKPSTESGGDEARQSRREQRTVFGPRRHTRFVGLYGGGSIGAPGLGGPSSGAVEVGAMLGGSLRLGAEFRGLSYGRTGPDVRLVSSGFVVGWAFKTRAMIHPTADVVLGGGLVSHQDGDVIGGVGLTAVRGGAELNLTRSVRLTASVGWRGIAAPNRDVRRDLDGLEGLVGVRVGWF